MVLGKIFAAILLGANSYPSWAYMLIQYYLIHMYYKIDQKFAVLMRTTGTSDSICIDMNIIYF